MNVYVDCTDLVFHQLATGIERVARNIAAHHRAASCLLGVDLRPVVQVRSGLIEMARSGPQHYLLSVWMHVRQPHRFRLLGISVLPFLRTIINRHWNGRGKAALFLPLALVIAPVALIATAALLTGRFRQTDLRPGDVYLVPGTSWWQPDFDFSLLKDIQEQGCRFVVIIHDLFPITHPDLCGDVGAFPVRFLELLKRADLLIANSYSTLREVQARMAMPHSGRNGPRLAVFRMGVDLDVAGRDAQVRWDLIGAFSRTRPYLSVGTIEPRKNYGFLLDAFERLWEQGVEVALCIVGRYGWKSAALADRIRAHPRQSRSLFWFEDLSDAELTYCYRNAKALLFPSVAEGFGLPLIEALSHDCPVMASDIPIFREIGGDRCAYFPLDSTDALCGIVRGFEASGRLPDVRPAPPFAWTTWQDSTLDLCRIMVREFGNPEDGVQSDKVPASAQASPKR